MAEEEEEQQEDENKRIRPRERARSQKRLFNAREKVIFAMVAVSSTT